MDNKKHKFAEKESKKKTSPKKNKIDDANHKAKIRERLYLIGIILLLLIGTALIFNEQLKQLWLQLNGNNSIEKYTAKDFEENQDAKVSYDFSKVESISSGSLLKYSGENIKPIGWISIPTVGISLPIANGVDNYTMLVAAGTMKPDEQMGEGNYALASHQTFLLNRTDMLFTPLYDVKIGQNIYLTDKRNIYTYRITQKRYVKATDVDLINDIPGQTLVTLITCDPQAVNRLMVQGEYVDKVSYKEAPSDIKKSFLGQHNNR